MRGKELWIIIFGLILLNSLTFIYFKTWGAGNAHEKVAVIGDRSISRQEWLNELEKRYGKDVLQDMVDQRVVKEIADKNKIFVSNKEVDQEFRLSQGTYSAPVQSKMDEQKWKSQIKYNLLLEEILTKDAVVTEKEMKKYYKRNQNLYKVPSVYHLSQIVVKTKSEADKAYNELSQGSGFSALAMERSIDEFSANQGGDIGFISKESEQYPESYIQTAQDLKTGKWSKPIKVDQGYAIIKLHKGIKGKSFSFADVKNQIRRQIAMEQMKTPASARIFWDEAKVTWFYGNSN